MLANLAKLLFFYGFILSAIRDLLPTHTVINIEAVKVIKKVFIVAGKLTAYAVNSVADSDYLNYPSCIIIDQPPKLHSLKSNFCPIWYFAETI